MVMEMGEESFQQRVIETVKRCQQRQDGPLIWAMEIGNCLNSGKVEPSPELGEVLVSYLCFQNNHPSLWKFFDYALSSRLLSPLHLLSLLTAKLVPHRRSQPQAFRLYLELLNRHALSFHDVTSDSCKHKIIESVSVSLELSQTYNVGVVELGHVFVLFFFTVIVRLIDSLFEDWGFPNPSAGVESVEHHSIMEIDSVGNEQHLVQMRMKNSLIALQVLNKLAESGKAVVLLRLVHFNMPEKFNGLLQRLQFLEANKLASSKLKSANQLLATLCSNVQKVLGYDNRLNKHRLIGMLVDTKSLRPTSCCNSESGLSACWLPFDIYMENAMDGRQLPVRSAIVILSETINTLRVLNRASWQETFLALWLSALRLVQRERDPPEGPVPHLEARLCMLLSIVPLAIADVLAEESKLQFSKVKGVATPGCTETGFGRGLGGQCLASIKEELISSLQVLENFTGLLCPPASAVGEANNAAAKAARFISISQITTDGLVSNSPGDPFLNSGGNMRHLIVEACIARNLIDTSAYFWHGYVPASVIALSELSPVQKSPWSMFMEGAPLNGSLTALLFSTPASSLAEIEKLYHIALNGLVEERSAAAKILCGASLTRGWNIQEEVVCFLVKILSPPVPPGYTGPRSHLIDHMSMLSAILFEVSTIDTIHILSMHGVIPEVAAAVMPLCEVFGSLVPTSSNKSNSGDGPSFYMVFSSAFLFLLRLWKFYRPPLEQSITDGAMGVELNLEYLLLLRNYRIASHYSASQNEINSNLDQQVSDKPIYLDHFPKLRAWYCQNKSCIASAPSGLSTSNPVHQVANKILSMIYSKMTKSGASSGNSSTPSTASVSESPASTGEDVYQRPILPAWELLEAIPFVLEAVLTACAYGRLSSRDLTTGLRDLVDFLPASLAAIISYFSAEVTRGVWKPVPMNGIDWPSPAANLPSIESELKAILAAAGVNVPLCSCEKLPIVLPLPLAAFVSLTITFKLNKSLEYLHGVVGPALENCASGCPWPIIPIIGSLWAQKARGWHEFIVVSCSRTVFIRNKEAVVQLLRSCFTSFLGSLHVSPLLTNQSSVDNLLGCIVSAHTVCPAMSIAPGFLYLRSCRTIHDVEHISDVIVGLVAEYAREAAGRWASSDSHRLKSSRASLSLASSKAREVGTLGASLLFHTGGLHMVQELYRETIPTWLLSSREEKAGKASAVARIMEGYAMAYMLVLSGSLMWGVGATTKESCTFSRRALIISKHLEFLGRVLDGNISLGCHPATWKAYVSCLVGLIVSCAPAWVEAVQVETLKKLANGLKGWHECELALSLLERGGIESIGCVIEMLDVIN
ncbi:mediator of RNA polymerase II transcription subunit 33A-like isoform X1 [Pistacia vera]|uniref:mediator of RNA polymerase II transcription subunit 33A-like isoform X1 n=1 Tax=Pistacia vera TaxID=55513 RepID=UPI0012636332|nr:mediator of RNA polymerase II transcription subunit 33A-like isoform X1 [Pistacia vera]